MASPLQSVPKDRYSLPRDVFFWTSPSFVTSFRLQWNSSENPNGLQQVKKQEMGKLWSYAMENATTDICSKSITDRICNYLIKKEGIIKNKGRELYKVRTLLWLLYHLKQQTLSHILKPSMCHTVNICSWPAFQQRISSKGLPGRAATRGTLLVSVQSWNLNTWKLRQ